MTDQFWFNTTNIISSLRLLSSQALVFIGRYPKRQMLSSSTEISRDVLNAKISSLENNIDDAVTVFDSIDQNSQFTSLFTEIRPLIKEAIPYLHDILDNYHHFKFSDEIPFNGYLSFLQLYLIAIDRLNSELDEIKEKRGSSFLFFWNADFYLKTLQSWISMFRILNQLTECCSTVLLKNHSGNLFIKCSALDKDHFELLTKRFKLQSVYGRTIAFQVDDSLNPILTNMVVSFLCFAENFTSSNMCPSPPSLSQSLKYKINAELRSEKMVETMNSSNLCLIKSFYTSAEHNIFQLMSPEHASIVNISSAFKINGYVSPDEKSIEVNVRLISSKYIPNMNELPCKIPEQKDGQNFASQSDVLLFHMHGGGFIAMSSKSHEVYLCPWARQLNVPILSVDYTLLPDAIFPTQLNECFVAYKWALENHSKLGWTGKKIIVVGDSAGGNLACSLTLFTIKNGIRVPDAMCLFYPVLSMGVDISPSRLLSTIDVLINSHTMILTAAAYSGIFNEQLFNENNIKDVDDASKEHQGQLPNAKTIINQIQQNASVFNNPYISPLSADESVLCQFPEAIYIWACGTDPLLDDSIQMAINIRKSGRLPKLKVFPSALHGFLNLYENASICKIAFQSSLHDLGELVTLISA